MDNFNLSSKNYNKASNYDVPMLFSLFTIHSLTREGCGGGEMGFT